MTRTAGNPLDLRAFLTIVGTRPGTHVRVHTRAAVIPGGSIPATPEGGTIEASLEPFDVVNLRLEVPTVKGARQKAPSFMSFEVTSEQQEGILPFLEQVRALVHDAGLVLVSEKPL